MGFTNLLKINQVSAESVRVSNYVLFVVFDLKPRLREDEST